MPHGSAMVGPPFEQPQHPGGTIIIPNPGNFRHTQFIVDLFALRKPPGTHVLFPVSGYIVQNLNRALQQMLGEWAWFQADDHTFGSDLLVRLLDHEVDVVVPLIVRRGGEAALVIGSETTAVDEYSGREYPAYDSVALEDLPSQEGLFTVDIAGTAGMLVRKHVLDAVGYPWFETTDGLKLNEDIVFSKKVRAAGFEIHVDPRARMGHIFSIPVWPF